jgi:hypothetical protein
MTKKYNDTISPFYTVGKEKENYDALQKVKIGGKLFLKRNRHKVQAKSPDAYLEYITPEEVAAYAERNGNKDSESL